MADMTFDELCEAASREARGRPSPADEAALDADLDAWASVLRHLIRRVDDQVQQRELDLAEAEVLDAGAIDQRRIDYYQWARRARWFQSNIRRRLEEVDRRRAAQAHHRLRALVTRLDADGAFAADRAPYLVQDEIDALLTELADVDPLAIAF